ncbi:MAG: phosphatidylglycerol:prolipoprotein diacylglycerol transferase [Parcubacteria group bacterium Gr01-1014_106]|nr:MAG: phosphatidylglycerol:prolipoprotein diacylglycerol transferase [Parcubacteria group bacterium Gr01-1014_106]
MPWLDYSPVAVVQLGSLPIRLWGVFVALGILVATAVAARRGERVGIPRDVMWNLSFWMNAAGFVGGRVLYVVEHWRDYIAQPLRIFAVWEGGMAIFGGLVAGTATVVLFARRYRIPLRVLADTAVPTLLLGDAIGRLGGAVSHMYTGIPTSFPLSYMLDGVQRHEVGIELSLMSLLGFLLMLWLERFKLPLGALTLVWYALERFLLDFLRSTDLPNSDPRYAGLTMAQYFAIGGMVIAGFFLIRFWQRGQLRGSRA